jgi:hypothetical protein
VGTSVSVYAWELKSVMLCKEIAGSYCSSRGLKAITGCVEIYSQGLYSSPAVGTLDPRCHLTVCFI